MKVKFFTNTSKSQFRKLDNGNWQITGIPMTVDNAVMNGILYPENENINGLNSYRGSPVTLRHPEDENGNPISAMDGEALMNHFSGGTIVNTYNHSGINYADAEFKEALLLAQTDGEVYLSKLKNGEDIGISTGLFFDGNNESGVSANGDEYHAIAKNQVGDHLAMLPDNEPPAGGEATFIRFNGNNDDQELSINIDEFIDNIGKEAQAVIDEMATNKEEKTLLTKFFAACKLVFATDKDNCDNAHNNENLLTNEEEGDAMRETLIAMLAAKGVTVNAEITDADLLAKYNEANTPDIAGAINAAVAPLTKTIEALEAQVTSNADKELDDLAKQAAPLMGVEEADAKAMGVNALHKVLAKNGVVVGAPNATNHKSPEKEADLITLEPWEKK